MRAMDQYSRSIIPVATTVPTGRAVQVDSIKTRAESAHRFSYNMMERLQIVLSNSTCAATHGRVAERGVPSRTRTVQPHASPRPARPGAPAPR
jgi:hypothetical protein